MPTPDPHLLTCFTNWLWNGVNRGNIKIRLPHTITDFCIVQVPGLTWCCQCTARLALGPFTCVVFQSPRRCRKMEQILGVFKAVGNGHFRVLGRNHGSNAGTYGFPHSSGEHFVTFMWKQKRSLMTRVTRDLMRRCPVSNNTEPRLVRQHHGWISLYHMKCPYFVIFVQQ